MNTITDFRINEIFNDGSIEVTLSIQKCNGDVDSYSIHIEKDDIVKLLDKLNQVL